MSNENLLMFGRLLRNLREQKKMSMDKVCEAYNEKFGGKINKSTLSKYENGTQEPLFTTLSQLAELFEVSISYLTGKDQQDGASKKKSKRVPLLGQIAAGQPIYTDENIVGYEETDNNFIDYCLRVKGDSMIGARIYDGDIVFISRSCEIVNGDIVVALIDDETATIKRFYKYGNKIILRSENPTMKEMEFDNKDKNVTILGKVKEVKFKV